jgi:HlyD family secretion protein
MKRIAIGVVLFTILSLVVFLYWRRQKPQEESGIRVSGNIEITDAAVSFKIPGRVLERLVTEGDQVKAGQVVAKLDEKDLQQEVALRQAEVGAAKAALQELEAGSRPEEIQKASASLASAVAQEDRWKKEYERQKGLFEKDVISQRELEAAKMSYETAVANVKEAEEALKLQQKGPRIEQIEQARARLQQAEESRALSETNLSYAILYSPLTGLVLSKSIEPGEYVSAGTPIVTVGEMNDVWLRAYINETDLGRVRVGQDVQVTTDSYPGKIYPGRISFISSQSEFTPKNVQTEKERVKLVYRIKVNISNPEMQLKPGMPADGKILPTGS